MLRGMRENDVRRALAAGESPIGLMIFEYGTTGIARMCRVGGADFVLYDMEHSGWTPETVKVLLETARAAGITPFVRVRDSGRSSVSLMLDLGALGLMIPMVESADQARRIVDYARYAPAGSRGVAVYHADDIEPEGLPATLTKANREAVLMAQIETVAGVEHVADYRRRRRHRPALDRALRPDDVARDAGSLLERRRTPPPSTACLRAAAAAGKPVGSLANDVADARRLLGDGVPRVLLGDSPVFAAALIGARRVRAG